eukprot:1460087-Pleurochrysis_carterae.AAC.2
MKTGAAPSPSASNSRTITCSLPRASGSVLATSRAGVNSTLPPSFSLKTLSAPCFLHSASPSAAHRTGGGRVDILSVVPPAARMAARTARSIPAAASCAPPKNFSLARPHGGDAIVRARLDRE